MSVGYFHSKQHLSNATFELFFRKSPFKGDYAVFGGEEEIRDILENCRFEEDDIDYLKTVLPEASEDFYDYLRSLSPDMLSIKSVKNGTIVFPNTPLVQVSGPILLCQLIETPLLNCVNYATLMSTNACRHRIAAGFNASLLEFGLRRAQGPDGAMMASKYSVLGGFDATSNTLAGKLLGLSVKGTMAHAFITSFKDLSTLHSSSLKNLITNKVENFVEVVLEHRTELNFNDAHDGELAAFIAYAQTFPNGFLALVDTYNTIDSGCKNFCAVAMALLDFGYKPSGIRLDSGDLVQLSNDAYAMFINVFGKDFSDKLSIVASNDINEEILLEFAEQKHHINVYGIGTNLVTCQRQPALGGVYKMQEFDDTPRIKLSNLLVKVSIPGKKRLFRLFNENGIAMADCLTCTRNYMNEDEAKLIPQINEHIVLTHPYTNEQKVFVPHKVVEILNDFDFNITELSQGKSFLYEQIKYGFDPKIFKSTNSSHYFMGLTTPLYNMMQKMWKENLPKH
eukprot:TRINITY_DN2620_c0_g1_i1.p1 TRINITY_DN2620_c0_g1~~TRINITY_DN2620_c0_g1_i1.p1  ORF type:complete len:537 (-),score=153.77 TRINITY_DN2620_c0_g1_i1:70-1596(-)